MRQRRTNPQPHQPPARFNKLALVLLLGLVFGGYLNSLANRYSLDDETLLLNNPHLNRDTSWPDLLRGPSDGEHPSRYQPLTMISFALDYRGSSRTAPATFRKMNALAHAVCVVLVYLLAWTWTRRVGLSISVAALFAVHPLATACVSNLSERGQLFATVHVLLALGAFGFARRSVEGMAGVSFMAYAVALLAGAAAVFSAETALILPALIALYLLAFDTGTNARRWLWIAPFVALDIIYMVARRLALGSLALPADVVLPAWRQLVMVPQLVGESVWVMIAPWWPQQHQELVTVPWMEKAGASIFGVALVGAIVTLWLWRGRRRLPAEWFGAAWTLTTIVPLWFVARRTGMVAESWLYLPLVGLTLVVSAAVLRILEHTPRINVSLQTVRAGVALVIAALLTRTLMRNDALRRPTVLLAEEAAERPESVRAHYRYGVVLARDGATDKAREEFRRAVELDPNSADAQRGLAVALGEAGQTEEAVRHFREVLRLQPDNPQARYDLAVALDRHHEYVEAVTQYREALAGETKFAAAANNLAWLLATCPVAEVRDASNAVAWATLAMKWSSADDPDALDTLAAAKAEAGKFNEALDLAGKAEQIATERAQTEQAAKIRSRAILYLQHKPYREAP